MKVREWINQRYQQSRGEWLSPTEAQDLLLKTVIDYIDEEHEMRGSGNPFPPPGPVGPAESPDASGANGAAGGLEARKQYSVEEMLVSARLIWGPERLSVADVVVRLGVDYGKLARCARAATKDNTSVAELELCFGNIIFSMIHWADSLGLDVHQCVERASGVQARFAIENPKR